MISQYHISSIADTVWFGRYRYYSFEDILANNPSYIYWCFDKIEEFSISPKAIDEIRELFPEFVIPLSFRDRMLTDEELEEALNGYADTGDECPDDSYEEEFVEPPTYERYNGSWAQDVEGYSDDDIDTIFDGDPDAYWNID